MTIRAPFDIPYENDAFVAGTRAITMQEDWEATPGDGHTYYLSRRFTFAEGDYTFKVIADDAATIWIGQNEFTTRMIVSCALTDEVGQSEVSVNIPAGVYRIDVLIENIPAGDNPCYVALNILKDTGGTFYASTKDGWLLDDAPIGDADLPPVGDPRLLLPIFSILPNWKTGVVERLSWETDIMGSESEAEQRRSVRRNPRRYFEASFLRAGSHRSRLDNFLIGMGQGQFMVPIWIEQLRLINGLSLESSGVVFVDNDGGLREFRDNDLVFVNNGDPDDYDILTINNVTNERFGFVTPPKRPWPAGSRIYPMRAARVIDDPQITMVSDNVMGVNMRFDFSEPDIRPASWGSNVGGQPVLHLRPNWGDAFTKSYSRQGYTLDNVSGPALITDTGRYSAANVRFSSHLRTRSDIYAFRQFMSAARGRTRHFFCSTFANDIQLASDILDGDQFLMAQPSGYSQYMSRPQPLRLTVAIDLGEDAPLIYRQITNVEAIYAPQDEDNSATPARVQSELLIVDAPLPAIYRDQIRRISFVTETRFEQDQFELLHSVAGQQKVVVAVTLRQAHNPRDVSL